MSLGRLFIAAVLFFAAIYIHVFVPLWAQSAREPLFELLDRQGFFVSVPQEEVSGVLRVGDDG